MPAMKAFSRLPSDVIPINYQITLTPDLQSFKFSGYEVVEVDVSHILLCYISLIAFEVLLL